MLGRRNRRIFGAMNYSNKSTSSSSTQTSSIFSNDNEDYDKLIREIEEYYIRTLLNENEEEEEQSGKDRGNYQIYQNYPNYPNCQQYQHLVSLGTHPSVASDGEYARYECKGYWAQRSQFKESFLEVEINPQYRPATGIIPLTSENLRMINEDFSSTVEKGRVLHGEPALTAPSCGGHPEVITACKKGSHAKECSCTVAEQHEKVNRQLYKTELCESFSTRGVCKYGDKCQFAHGLHELKLKERSTNFRTKPCLNWAKYGYCRYGKRCCFKHGEDKDIEVYLQAGTIKKPNEAPRKKNDHANIKVLQKITW